MSDPEDPPPLGGRYELERELGRGGSAVVYLARDKNTDQRVAVKLLSEELAHGIGMERFAREIRVMMRLRHPHILPILDSGTSGHRPYYVMPYVEGETLSQRLERDRQLSVEEVTRLAEALCSALGYAHEQQVLHRDVKSANVLLTADGAYLTDFGLAFEAGALSGERITSSGIVAGTSAYMSPEQVSAERRLDHRTDIYSLGCVLYEALAGVRPFQGATEPAIRAMRLTRDPPPLRAFRPGVPPQIEAALARAMAREPADRWNSAQAFARAFAAPSVPLQREGVRIPRWAMLAAAVAVLVVAAVLWNRSRTPRTPGMPIGVTIAARYAAGNAADSAQASRAARSVVDVLAQLPKLDVSLGDAAGGGRGSTVGYAASVEVRSPAGARELWLTLTPQRERDATTRYSAPIRADADIDSVAGSLAIGALRTMAVRDSATLLDTRAAVLATTVPTALAQLLEAQRLFGQSDGEGAVRALHAAIAADSSCALAIARLATVYNWLHHYDSATTVVDSFVRRRQPPEAMLRLLRGARAFALGRADSAIGSYQRSVVDEPSNVDGWFGLAESLFHLGWRIGHSADDARSAYAATARIDSAFAPMYYHYFDLALANNDTSLARTLLSRISTGDGTFASRRLALALATLPSQSRDSALRSLIEQPRSALSELVVFFARRMKNANLADSIARALTDTSRTPDDRLRGFRYRVVLAPATNRIDEALTDLREVARPADLEDPWLASLALAGLVPATVIEDHVRVARERVRSATGSEALMSPDDALWQAGELLAACALLELSHCDVRRIRESIASLQARRKDANGTVRRWMHSLDARLALTRGDTTQALDHLASAQLGLQETFFAYYPLASFPAQRLVEAEVLCARRSPNADIVRLTFTRSESVADAAFAAAPRLKCSAQSS